MIRTTLGCSLALIGICLALIGFVFVAVGLVPLIPSASHTEPRDTAEIAGGLLCSAVSFLLLLLPGVLLICSGWRSIMTHRSECNVDYATAFSDSGEPYASTDATNPFAIAPSVPIDHQRSGRADDVRFHTETSQSVIPPNTPPVARDSLHHEPFGENGIDWLLAPIQATSISLSHYVTFNERNVDGLESLIPATDSGGLSVRGIESVLRQFEKSKTFGNMSHLMVAQAVRLAPLPQMKSCAICGEQVIAGHAIQPVECVMSFKYSAGTTNVNWKHVTHAQVRWPLCSVCFSVVSTGYPSLMSRLKNCVEPFFLRHPFLAFFIPNTRSNAQQLLRQRLLEVCHEVRTPTESLMNNRRRLLLPKACRYDVELSVQSCRFGVVFVNRQKGSFEATVRSTLQLVVPSQKFASTLFPSVDFPKPSLWLGLGRGKVAIS